MAVRDLEQIAAEKSADDTLEQVMVRAVIGLAEEVGEVTRPIKRYLFRGESYQVEDLMLEVGDVLYNCARLAAKHGYTLDQVAAMTVAKYRSRAAQAPRPHRSVPILAAPARQA